MSKNKKMIIVLLAIISIICITAGVTLAFLSYTKEGVKENKITAGSITFHYNEDSNQGISLGDALPLSDSAGKTQNKYFDFTITSNNNIEGTIPYTITARKVSNPANELDEQYIKVYLTRVTSGNSESQLLFDTYDHLSTEQHNNHDEEVLWSDSVDANTANYEQRYRLRIWIADTLDFSPEKNLDGTYKEVNGEYVYPNNNKEFSIKLNVYSEAEAGIRLAAGLYDYDDNLRYTWQELVDNNLVTVTDGVLLAGTNSNRKNLLYGKLVIDDSVTSIGSAAFYEYNNLRSIEIPSSVTSIGTNAFRGCILLNSVTFESGSELTSIGSYAFSGCQSLTSIEISSGVTSIGDSAFSGCTKLASVTFASGSQLTSIGSSAFTGCTGLTSVEIPASVISIGNNAFNRCKSLTSIRIPSAVTSIASNAFEECTGLASIVVDSNNTTYDSRNNSNAIIKTSTNELVIGCKNTVIPASVTTIGYQAFYKCTGLTSIEIPASVTSIGNSAFYGCTGLTSIEIPSSVTSIGNSVFYGCTGLTSVTFASGSQLTSIGQFAFHSCTGLTSIEIPSSVTSIGAKIFYGCDNLTSIVVDSNNSIYDSRNNSNAIIKTSTNELVIGCKNTVIPSSVTSIENEAFFGCKSLISLEIPSSVTTIGQYAFSSCTGLTSVTFASGSQLTSIGTYAFNGCSSLTNIEIPSTVTTIGSGAFNGINTIYYSGSAANSPWGAGQVISNY